MATEFGRQQMSLTLKIAELLARMYSATSNEARVICTNTLLREIGKLTGEAEIVTVGMELLQLSPQFFLPEDLQRVSPSVLISIRSFGAVLLYRNICCSKLSPQSLQLDGLLSWYCSDSSIHPLMRHDLTSLVISCAVRTWPEKWPQFLECICSASLASTPFILPLLQQFLEICCDPSLAGNHDGFVVVPAQRFGTLRNGLKGVGKIMLERLISSMFVWYQQHDDASLRKGLECVASVALLLSPADWWAVGLDEVISVLSTYPPTTKEVCLCASVILRQQSLESWVSSGDEKVVTFADQILRQVEVFLNGQDWEAVQEMIELAIDLPQVLLHRLEQTIAVFIDLVLRVPSIMFAVSTTELFRRAIRTPALVIRNPLQLITSLQVLVQKHNVHPSYSRNANEGIGFSQSQYSTLESFETAFAEMRGNVSHVLNVLALHFPEICCEYCISLMSSLPSCRYSFDPVTPCGHVRQQSQTFSEWQASQFVLEQLITSFDFRDNFLERALATLAAKKPTDAVLVPVFLNVVVAFWSVKMNSVETQQKLWEWSVETIFDFMSLRSGSAAPKYPENVFPFEDVDLVSARKRAYTVFIHAAVYNAKQMVIFPQLNLIQRCQSSLISSYVLPSEKIFLYEAFASLSNEMSSTDQLQFVSSVVGPMKNLVCGISPTSEEIIRLHCGTSRDVHDLRTMLRDAVGILSAVLRRCNPFPNLVPVVSELIPVFRDLVLSIHSITPEQLPKDFQQLLELGTVDKDQFMGGSARKPNASADNCLCGKARSALQQLRLHLYQAMGSIGKFVNLATFLPSLLPLMLHNCEALHIHSMRAFSENTLFVWIREFPDSSRHILPAVQRFLTSQGSKSRSSQQEIVDFKQLYYYCKDVLSTVKGVTEISGWNSIEDVVVSLLECIIRSGFEPKGGAIISLRLIDCGPLSIQNASRIFCSVVLACGTSKQQERDFDVIAGILADHYVKNVPLYSEALRSLGTPTTLLDDLNAMLSIAPRVDTKRKKFKDFLKTVSESSGARLEN